MNSDNSFSSPAPKISILVPVYNDIDRVGLCIDKLLQIKYPKNQYEVIIIDNGSTDGTYEYLLERVSETQGNFLRLIQCLTPG